MGELDCRRHNRLLTHCFYFLSFLEKDLTHAGKMCIMKESEKYVEHFEQEFNLVKNNH